MKHLKDLLKAALGALVFTCASLAANAQTVTYFHNDVSGSPIMATNASGNVLWKENYAPYGDKFNREPSSLDNRIGFHGKPYDNDSQLSYMGARYYSPGLGRFLGIDPIDFQEDNPHSFNRYAYANNNPYKYVDPDGKLPVLAIIPLALKIADIALTAHAVHGAYQAGGLAGAGSELVKSGALNAVPGGKVADKIGDVAQGAAKASARRETGSYTNHHLSGKTYDGKGSRERSQESGRRVERETKDPHIATDWTPAGSQRDAFKQESQRLDVNGGPKSDGNYNKIESPGKNFRELDKN